MQAFWSLSLDSLCRRPSTSSLLPWILEHEQFLAHTACASSKDEEVSRMSPVLEKLEICGKGMAGKLKAASIFFYIAHCEGKTWRLLNIYIFPQAGEQLLGGNKEAELLSQLGRLQVMVMSLAQWQSACVNGFQLEGSPNIA